MKRLHRYVPESFHLLIDRAAERYSVQTPQEAESDAADLRKDLCPLHGFNVLPYCARRVGVPVVFSHKYDA